MRIQSGGYLGILVCLFLLCPGITPAHQEPGIEQDQYLANLVSTIIPGIVAVGTYYFNDLPKVRYLGTGFAVASGTKIITNYHVIERAVKEKKTGRLRIFHRDFDVTGTRVRIRKVDEFHDLALLEYRGAPLPALQVNFEEAVKPGYHVIFSGYPIGLVLGLNPTTHQGIISSVAPLIRPSPSGRLIDGKLIQHLNAPYKVYQIDAAAFPGNSGSPLLRTATGEVIGVINQVFVKERKEHALTDPSGITYAIPAGFIKALLE